MFTRVYRLTIQAYLPPLSLQIILSHQIRPFFAGGDPSSPQQGYCTDQGWFYFQYKQKERGEWRLGFAYKPWSIGLGVVSRSNECVKKNCPAWAIAAWDNQRLLFELLPFDSVKFLRTSSIIKLPQILISDSFSLLMFTIRCCASLYV